MTSSNFNALQSTPHIYRESDKVFDDLDSIRPNPRGLLQLEPEFRACDTYAQRIAFFEKYKLDDFLSLHCDVSKAQIYLKEIYEDEPKIVTSEILEEGHVVTLSPMTRSESIDFVSWALSRRVEMNHAPYTSQALIAAFQDKYHQIQSQLDKNEFLAKSQSVALEWKGLRVTDDTYELYQIQKASDKHLPVERRINIYLKVHLGLYVRFMNQLKNVDPIDLTEYYPYGRPFISWSVIDTYLFAKANYDFCLFLEKFTNEGYAGSKRRRKQTNDLTLYNNSSGFAEYLNQEYKETLLTYLVTKYTDVRPRTIVYMIFALSELGIVDSSIVSDNQTELHRALTVTFGDIGQRSSFNTAINRVNSSSDSDNRQVQKHKDGILKILEK